MSIEKKIKKNYDLANLTTFCVGGKAQYFIAVRNKQELIAAATWAQTQKLPLSFLAGGSNILITRRQIRGLVIRILGQDYKIKDRVVSSWAGTNLTKLAKVTSDQGLAGLEWALGLPGSLGGAVRGNAGAYGSDMSRLVAEVEAYDLARRKLIRLNNQACGFSYRQSIFKQRKTLLIINVKLKLAKGRSAVCQYLAKQNLNHRRQTNAKEPSAGCVFKNLEYKKLVKQNYELSQALARRGLVRGGKIGAAYLIDQLGLKGQARGGAKISEKHANFIVNQGGARAKDIIYLINLIKKKVKARYRIDLEEEIQRL